MTIEYDPKEEALPLEEFLELDVVDEDWLTGVSCNTEAPEECESCQ